MVATSRLKQLLFIIAALALVSLGLVASLSTASPARADDTQTCEPSPEVNEGPTGFLTAPPDGRAWQIAETRTQPGTGTADSTERINYAWTGGPSATHPVDSAFWQPNQGEHNGAPHDQPDGVPYQVGGGNSPWFLWKTVTTPGIPAVIEHTYTLHIDAVTCPGPAPDTCPVGTDHAGEEYPGETVESCDDPVVDDGKKVIVCKYVGTPPGTPDHFIVVSVNSLPGFDPENPGFPFPFGDAHDSIAIDFATGNEQPDDELVDELCPTEDEPTCEETQTCPEPPCEETQTCPPPEKKVIVCKYVGTPPGTPDHFIVVSVNSLPGFDPENPGFPFPFGDAHDSIAIDFATGNEQPDDELVDELCPTEDEPELCPVGTDHAGEEIPG